MNRTDISLDEEQTRLLRWLAAKQRRTLPDLVYEALDEYLKRHGLEPGFGIREPRPMTPEEREEWRSSFKAAVERMRASVPAGVSAEEIEEAITAASEEARQERLARKRSARA